MVWQREGTIADISLLGVSCLILRDIITITFFHNYIPRLVMISVAVFSSVYTFEVAGVYSPENFLPYVMANWSLGIDDEQNVTHN